MKCYTFSSTCYALSNTGHFLVIDVSCDHGHGTGDGDSQERRWNDIKK